MRIEIETITYYSVRKNENTLENMPHEHFKIGHSNTINPRLKSAVVCVTRLDSNVRKNKKRIIAAPIR